MTTSSSPTVGIRLDSPRPVDARALIQNTFQEFDDDADRKDGSPLMDAKLGLSLMPPFRLHLIKVLRTFASGALVLDRFAVASKAYCIRIEAGIVWQQCAPMREPHAANLGEPCVTIPLPLVVMSLIDGPWVSSRGVIVGFTGNCVARMVAIVGKDP